ncbi:hypothetical protein [Sphingomonas sp. Leaf25]|uniref:hypothetical protein n=1 Tax=Sphingomonas sp. Leaf25 TaxID=1735692 RepID=UPI0006F3BF23|nr:hypothetical protein [Sphingomonas sp. Leaf25]KQN00539.1 hypothetical protein ASE78_05485 [Sphingomonas sp. Leaf25]
MTIHQERSPLAGEHVTIVSGVLAGQTLFVEDWWDRLVGRSWMRCDSNPACMAFAVREPTPLDDEVVYGKIGGLGHLVHVSMLPTGEHR